MIIQPIPPNSPTFGYSHQLKTLYRQGKLPIRYGFYGDVLTQNNVSLEHLLPHSKSGKTDLSNLVLASKQKNMARGNADIRNFANKEMIIKLEEHKDELLDKLQEVIKQTIKNFVASKINH